MQRHTIGLKYPWKYRIIDSNSHREKMGLEGVVHGAKDWRELHSEDFCGTISLNRRFNLPTGLTDQQAVLICIDAAGLPANVVLNKNELGRVGGSIALQVDVTKILLPHNDLRLIASIDSTTPKNSTGRSSRGDLSGGAVSDDEIAFPDVRILIET